MGFIIVSKLINLVVSGPGGGVYMTFSQEDAIAEMNAMVKIIRINILSPLIAFSLNFIYKDF
jgi:hypothetical protein